MSKRLPIVNFRKMKKVLLKLGFEPVRQRGSHVFYRHVDSRTTTVPYHPGRDLARPLIREILREIELTPAEFRDVLRKV
ncbi:MAG: type II toxin-antitoxin system HicA family toxin [Anaerolineales bacterium]